MKIEHLAIWVKDLERSKEFYTTFFNMSCGEKYVNEKKQFSSYFLSFDEVAGEPRTTGDGYYESVVRDPDGNLVEITD